MKKRTLYITSIMIMTIGIRAETPSIIKNVEGYIRLGYQNTDISGLGDYTDLALGGKLHVDTASWNGISAEASFYTSMSLGENEGYLSGAGMPFFDGSGEGYAILGEAYLQGRWGNTLIKIGRQEIDTPFADTDDIGMVPNTFEAALLVNTDIKDATVVLAHIDRMAGVDAAIPGEFTELNVDNGVQAFGITYEGIEGVALSGWYYYADGIIQVPYLEAAYEAKLEGVTLGFGAQYAYMDWEGAPAAKVFGANLSASIESTGLTLGAAYNKSSDGAADDLFGGGPFFTSSEHLTLPVAGGDGEAVMLSAEWDAGIAGLKGLTLGIGHLTLEDNTGLESTELDLTASYAFSDALSLNLFYSDIDDKIDTGDALTNLRLFVNYTF